VTHTLIKYQRRIILINKQGSPRRGWRWSVDPPGKIFRKKSQGGTKGNFLD
jgi:hypothetical protein